MNPKHPATVSDATLVSFVPMAAVCEQAGKIIDAQPRHFGEIKKGYTHFADGDVLFAKITPCMENGKAASVRGLMNGLGCGTTEFFVLRSRGAIDQDYLFHFIRQESYRKAARATMQSGVGQARVTKEFVLESEIPFPCLAEQHRIVAKIEALQARSGKAREALEVIPPLLEQFRQSVLAAAFRGDLTADWREQHPAVEPASVLLERIRQERRRRWEEANPQKKYVEPEPVDDSDLPELPEGWCWAKWDEIGFCQNGRAFPSKNYTLQGVKLLRPGNLHVSGRLLWNEENTRYLPNDWVEEYQDYIIGPQELVMNLTAQSLKDEFLGRVCLSECGERCLLNQRLARLTPISLTPEFCLWLFKSPVFRRYVDELNTGSLIQHMFTSQVYDFAFPLPPLTEQAEVVRQLQRHLERQGKLAIVVDETLASVSPLEQSILAKAFRGELIEQDLADEPASALLERIRAVAEQDEEDS